MTSGSYLFKGIKENLRRNMYLMLLLFLGFQAVLPANLIMRLDGIRSTDIGMVTLREEFMRTIGPYNEALLVIVIAAGMFAALSQFGFLYSGEKTDFYHSLPMKRDDLFRIQFISGGISFLIPYLLSVLLAFFVGVTYGAVYRRALLAMAAAVAIHIVYFLVFYGIAVLAILLTGNLFVGALGFAGFLTYGPLLYQVYNTMNGRFFRNVVVWRKNGAWFYISPLEMYARLVASADSYYKANVWQDVKTYVIYGIVLALLLLAVNIWIYKKRPSEGFQKALAFEKMQPIVKVFVVMLFSLLLGLFFSGGMERRFFWQVAATMLAALILSVVMEFLYHTDIKKSIKPNASTGIILVVLAVVLFGYRIDIFKADSYLPDKNKIETMSVHFSGINDVVEYPIDYDMWNTGDFLDNSRIKDFEPIYALAQEGVNYSKNLKDEQYPDEEATLEAASAKDVVSAPADTILAPLPEGKLDYVNVNIAYHLKSGKTIYRTYNMPETETVLKNIEKIYNNWEYREKLMPTTYLKEDTIKHLYVTNFEEEQKQIDVKEAGITNLYKTYKQELESMTFDESTSENIIAYLHVEYNYNNDRDFESSVRFPIYASFEKTKAAIENTGIPMADTINTDNVESIVLSSYEAMGEESREVIIDKPEEMKKLLANLSYESGRLGVANDFMYNISVGINYKEGKRDFYNGYSNLRLRGTEEVKNILNKIKID